MLKYIKFNLFLESNFLDEGVKETTTAGVKGKIEKQFKPLEKLPEDKKTPVLDESKTERQELSNDLLKTISNKEFLKQPLEKRLQYITNPKVDYSSVAVGETKNINFTFTFDGKFNRDLYMQTTAGQVLPIEVNEVKIGDEIYTRIGIAGEFFNGNSRLIIKEGTKIEIPKTRSKEDLLKIEEENTKSYNEFLILNGDVNKVILQEAISRKIDPKFALLAFSKTYEATPENEKKVVLEDMMTYFDKYRGYLLQSTELKDGKYPEKLTLGILSKYNKDDWEQKALDYGIIKEKLDDYKSNGEIYIGMSSNDIKNGDSLPDGTYLKGDSLLNNPDFKAKLYKICTNLGARYEDMVKLMKAESGLDPRIVNGQSGATGLIQFMPNTAIDLGTSVGKIRSLTGIEQLDLVEKYFQKNSNGADLSTITKLYQVVFYPLSLKKDSTFVFGSEISQSYAKKVAAQNSNIASFSSRNDGLIDQNAFANYVIHHVSKITA